ncbi:MAG: hypothetical protein SOW59_01470 [Corynebacterium sp.]|nr:hypothetical protein [Corynebacterium sp.]
MTASSSHAKSRGFRRLITAATIATGIGATALTGAHAFTLADLDQAASGVITTASCPTVKTVLDGLNRANGGRIHNENTTRNQLVQNLRSVSGTTNTTDITTLAAIRYTGQFADRALACNLVKPDPQLPAGSSQINTLLNDFGPQLFNLSSNALPVAK